MTPSRARSSGRVVLSPGDGHGAGAPGRGRKPAGPLCSCEQGGPPQGHARDRGLLVLRRLVRRDGVLEVVACRFGVRLDISTPHRGRRTSASPCQGVQTRCVRRCARRLGSRWLLAADVLGELTRVVPVTNVAVVGMCSAVAAPAVSVRRWTRAARGCTARPPALDLWARVFRPAVDGFYPERKGQRSRGRMPVLVDQSHPWPGSWSRRGHARAAQRGLRAAYRTRAASTDERDQLRVVGGRSAGSDAAWVAPRAPDLDG